MVAPGDVLSRQLTPSAPNVKDSAFAEGLEAFLFCPIISNCSSYSPCPQYAQALTQIHLQPQQEQTRINSDPSNGGEGQGQITCLGLVPISPTLLPASQLLLLGSHHQREPPFHSKSAPRAQFYTSTVVLYFLVSNIFTQQRSHQSRDPLQNTTKNW